MNAKELVSRANLLNFGELSEFRDVVARCKLTVLLLAREQILAQTPTLAAAKYTINKRIVRKLADKVLTATHENAAVVVELVRKHFPCEWPIEMLREEVYRYSFGTPLVNEMARLISLTFDEEFEREIKEFVPTNYKFCWN